MFNGIKICIEILIPMLTLQHYLAQRDASVQSVQIQGLVHLNESIVIEGK